MVLAIPGDGTLSVVELCALCYVANTGNARDILKAFHQKAFTNLKQVVLPVERSLIRAKVRAAKLAPLSSSVGPPWAALETFFQVAANQDANGEQDECRDEAAHTMNTLIFRPFRSKV